MSSIFHNREQYLYGIKELFSALVKTMPKVKITPLRDTLIENGVAAAEKFDKAVLKKLDWPSIPGKRSPEGGNGGDFYHEMIKVKWEHDKLILTTHFGVDVQEPMGHRSGNEIIFDGNFIAQLDADVAYFPEKHLMNLHSKDFLMFVCVQTTTTKEKMFRAIKIPHGCGILIEAFVAHSMPIPLHDDSVEFKCYHRNANSVAQFKLVEPLHVDLNDIDESTTLTVAKLVEGAENTTKIKLPNDFSSELLKIEEATQKNICNYGLLVENCHDYEEKVTHVSWPCTAHLFTFPGLEIHQEDMVTSCKSEELIQDFKMTWIPHSLNSNEKVIRFNGLTGSFEGAEGKPGVEFDSTTGIYKVNTLQTRPDGSFYLFQKTKHHKFIMVLAKSDKHTCEPIKETLKAFVFEPGQGIRLEPYVWHSVPILLAIDDSATFREIVAETNANVVANVEFESNGPLRLTF